MISTLIFALAVSFAPTGSGCCASGPEEPLATSQPATVSTKPATTRPATTPATSTAPAVDPAAMKILDALEQAGEKYPTIRADVVLVETDRMLGENTTRTGWFAYQKPDESKKLPARFRIAFETLKQDDEKRIRAREDYAFDGTWLTVAKHKIKQMTRYQVVPKGQRIEPMKLGKGPFPMPFGQKTEDVLKHFVATTRAPTKRDPKDTDYLKLTTRRQFRKVIESSVVELWVHRKTGLPVRIVTTDRNKKRLAADFSKLRTDAKLDAKLFHLPKPFGWQLHVQPLEKPARPARR